MPPLSPAEDHVGKAELGEAGETPRREQIPMPLSVFVFLTVVMTTIREPTLSKAWCQMPTNCVPTYPDWPAKEGF